MKGLAFSVLLLVLFSLLLVHEHAPPTLKATTAAVQQQRTAMNQQNRNFLLPFDLANCTQIFLDCGSNRGNQLRKLYDGEKEGSPWGVFFRSLFSNDTLQRQRDVCSVAWEPDIKHQSVHRELQRRYAAMGIRSHTFFHPIWINNDNLTFYMRNTEVGNEGSSIMNHSVLNKDAESITTRQVEAFNFVHLISTLQQDRNKRTIVIKFDIEGAEHAIYYELFFRDLMCNLFLAMEVHPFWPPEFPPSPLTEYLNRRKRKVNFAFQQRVLRHRNDCRRTVVMDLDDET